MVPSFSRGRPTPTHGQNAKQARIDFTLCKDVEVSGEIVVGAERRAAMCRSVQLVSAESVKDYDPYWVRRFSGFTDDLGEFEAAGVAPGEYTVSSSVMLDGKECWG